MSYRKTQTQKVIEFGTVTALREWLDKNPSYYVVALTSSTRQETAGNLVAVIDEA